SVAGRLLRADGRRLGHDRHDSPSQLQPLPDGAVPDGLDHHDVARQVRHADPALSPRRVMKKTIQNSIRRFRFDRKEMTQQELADKIGVTRQTVNAIELGKYSPSLEVAFRIADVFGVPLDEVFQYENITRSRS